MKKSLLLLSAFLLMITAFAQEKPEKKTLVTVGFTGALNMAKFDLKNQATSSTTDYDFRSDGVGGFWFNFPLSKRLSFEPQLLFITNKVAPTGGTSSDFNGKVNYFGIPLLLKIHAGKYIAFPVGPQIDIRRSVKNNPGNLALSKSSTESYSLGLSGGIEIMPKARFTIFGRYIYGLTTINNPLTSSRPYEAKNQNIYAGFKVKLFDFYKKKKIVPPPPPEPPKDTDGDGIIDSLDKCPTVPGLPKYDGCPIPDTDKDGINDEEDKCPTVPGIAKYQGCPIPDTDKDGINDENDKCPTVPGVPEYQGCPVPDRDKDGVPDEKDKCPDLFGVASNQGCPEITEEIKKKVEVAAKNILFVTGSAKLRSQSFVKLADVITIMNENPDMLLAIDGHTDNVGKEDFNQTLSENRAASVKAYLVSKGIDESRITATGHGELEPIADNKTAAGRQQNRRSELTLSYFK